MRTVIAGIPLIFLVFSAPFPSIPVALAQDSCSCKGCGCKGGSGWRGPKGYCVSNGRLAKVCGTPPGAPCRREAAAQICFGGQQAAAPDAATSAK